jgi:hypothetical protein
MSRARVTLAALLVALAAGLLLSACGVSYKPSDKSPKAQAKPTQASGIGVLPAAVTQPGSGAVVGAAVVSTKLAAAGAQANPVDATYGPPDSAVSSEDVPNGNTGLIAQNGTPSASLTDGAARTKLSETYQPPTDQDFTGQWFAGNSPWNTDIANLPIDKNSAEMLRLGQFRVSVVSHGSAAPTTKFVKDNSGVFINTVAWTDPVVRGGPETPVHCRQTPDCGDDPDNRIKELAIPHSVNPNPYYDGWFTVISPNGKIAYDMWRARRLADGSISFEYMRIWNLEGSGYSRPNTPSARGSGLPLFAGLIRPQELEQGQIDHALAISVPGPAQRYYVQPASTTDGNGSVNSIPEGARIRLKASVHLPAKDGLTAIQRRYASALLWTLRNFGAIVVDRSAVPTLYGQQGVTAALLSGNELQFLNLSDFEVVNLPPEQQYPSTSKSQSALVSSVGAAGGGGY